MRFPWKFRNLQNFAWIYFRTRIYYSVLLYEFHRRKPGWRLTAGLKHNTEPQSIGSARDPRTSVNFVIAFVFLLNFYVKVTSFVLLTLNISYWSLILCDYQLLCSTKPLFPTLGRVRRNVEKWGNFIFFIFKSTYFIFENCKIWKCSKSYVWNV